MLWKCEKLLCAFDTDKYFQCYYVATLIALYEITSVTYQGGIIMQNTHTHKNCNRTSQRKKETPIAFNAITQIDEMTIGVGRDTLLIMLSAEVAEKKFIT